MGTRFLINYPNNPPTLDGNLPNTLTSWLPQRNTEDNRVLRQGNTIVLSDYDALYFRNRYVNTETVCAMVGPPQVTNVFARGVPGMVNLIWAAINPMPSYYVISRSTDNSTFTQIGITSPTLTDPANTFADNTVIFGTNYYYQIHAVDSYSLASNPVGSSSSSTFVPASSFVGGDFLLIGGGTLLLIGGGNLLLVNH